MRELALQGCYPAWQLNACQGQQPLVRSYGGTDAAPAILQQLITGWVCWVLSAGRERRR
jgi:hypothetical protein